MRNRNRPRERAEVLPIFRHLTGQTTPALTVESSDGNTQRRYSHGNALTSSIGADRLEYEAFIAKRRYSKVDWKPIIRSDRALSIPCRGSCGNRRIRSFIRL